jgi:hypothetical protein
MLSLSSRAAKQMTSGSRLSLLDVFNLRQAPCGGHRGVVHGCHLSGEHYFGAVVRDLGVSAGARRRFMRSIGGLLSATRARSTIGSPKN